MYAVLAVFAERELGVPKSHFINDGMGRIRTVGSIVEASSIARSIIDTTFDEERSGYRVALECCKVVEVDDNLNPKFVAETIEYKHVDKYRIFGRLLYKSLLPHGIILGGVLFAVVSIIGKLIFNN